MINKKIVAQINEQFWEDRELAIQAHPFLRFSRYSNDPDIIKLFLPVRARAIAASVTAPTTRSEVVSARSRVHVKLDEIKRTRNRESILEQQNIADALRKKQLEESKKRSASIAAAGGWTSGELPKSPTQDDMKKIDRANAKAQAILGVNSPTGSVRRIAPSRTAPTPPSTPRRYAAGPDQIVPLAPLDTTIEEPVFDAVSGFTRLQLGAQSPKR